MLSSSTTPVRSLSTDTYFQGGVLRDLMMRPWSHGPLLEQSWPVSVASLERVLHAVLSTAIEIRVTNSLVQDSDWHALRTVISQVF